MGNLFCCGNEDQEVKNERVETIPMRVSLVTNPIEAIINAVFEDNEKLHNWYNFPISYTVDTFKGVTPLVILLMMYIFRGPPHDAFSNPIAWTYLGTHGSYGILWASKNLLSFGDFHQKGSLVAHSLTIVLLIMYWIPIYLICSRTVPTPVWIIGPAVLLYSCGVFWHFVADMQKTMFIEFRALVKKEFGKEKSNINNGLGGNLLRSKLWKYTRNPNYFGEMLIYGSFCVLSYHWLPFLLFGAVMVLLWRSLMEKKDKSLSRFGKEFDDYKSTSSFFFPKL
jgi:protein-S-isoprenylcysteine O-methyltransferase Ste14